MGETRLEMEERLRISYPMTPVDALLSDLYAEFKFGNLTDDFWAHRMTQFWKEVGALPDA